MPQWLHELLAWWDALPREMVFFFSLPFIVAAAGLLLEWTRRLRH